MKITLKVCAALSLCILILGCVPAYTFNNISYQSPNEALQAARASFNRGVQNVEVRSEPIGNSLRIVTPDRGLTRRHGVQVTGNVNRAQAAATYVTDLLMTNYASIVRAVERASLFASTRHELVNSTFNQEIGDNDALLVLHTPAFGQFQWFLSTRGDDEKHEIHFDSSKSNELQMASFVNNLEKSLIQNTDLAQKSPKTPRGRDNKNGSSSGTGFFINAQGYALTNYHVVEGCNALIVKNKGINSTSAVVIAEDSRNDLAVIKVNTRNTKFAKLRSSSSPVRQGEEISVFGYPYSGLLSSGGNYSEGIVSALSGMGEDTRFYQVSAPVQPGNSGGAMTDTSGLVVGVVTAKLNALKVASVMGDIPQNVNFAIKSDFAKIFLNTNGIEYSEQAKTDPISKTDLAAKLQTYSFHIKCN